jgi:hypothetical protein
MSALGLLDKRISNDAPQSTDRPLSSELEL